MKRSCYLVDTGALVALFDRSEPEHSFVSARWGALKGDFLTTGAVITETFYFMQTIRGGEEIVAGFLRKGMVAIEDCFLQNQIDAAAELMVRYRDTPMDFADATLVLLAERLGIPNVLTLDERGFRTFRFAGKRSFKLTLQDH